MNYFSSKNHVSWCCFLFKCKLTQKNSFILSFEQKASDFLKGRGKEKGKEKAEGKEKAGRKREKAMQPSCTEPNPTGDKRQKGREEGKRKGRKERRKEGKASPKIIGRGYGLPSVIDAGY